MPAGFLRTFAKVATMDEALEVARALLTAIGPAATVKSLKVEPYYKEEGWIEISPSFSEIDLQAVMDRLAADWVDAGACFVWNPEAHWNQGEGVSFAVPHIVWALVEAFEPEAEVREVVDERRHEPPET